MKPIYPGRGDEFAYRAAQHAIEIGVIKRLLKEQKLPADFIKDVVELVREKQEQ